ncbi:MAG: ABC transporter permease subunit [Actinomycetota bacterium]
MKPSLPALANVVAPAALCGVWLGLSLMTPRAFIPLPFDVLAVLPEEVESGRLVSAAAHTVGVTLAAAAAAVTAGTLTGMLFGSSPRIAAWALPSVEVLRTVPALTLIPVTVLALGPTLGTEVSLATYAALWPMVLSTAGAVGSVHPRQFDVARTLRLGRRVTMRAVVLPGAMPVWLAGARVSVTLGFLVAIVVEMVITTGGLGTVLIESLAAFSPERMWVYVLTCGVIGLLLNAAVQLTVAAAQPGPVLTNMTHRIGLGAPSARGLLPLGVLIIVWEIAGSPASLTVPPPSEWFLALAGLHADASLIPAIGHTLVAYLGGLVAAAVVGGAIGMALGSSPVIDRAVSPTLNFVAAVPGAVLVPVLVLLLGPNEISGIVAVGAIVAWPVLLNTAAFRRSVPPTRRDAARTLGLSSYRQWGSVTFPSSLPGVAHGVRVSSGLALIIALLTDIFGAGAGIGRLLIESQQRFDAAEAWGLLLVVATMGYLVSVGLSKTARVMDPVGGR